MDKGAITITWTPTRIRVELGVHDIPKTRTWDTNCRYLILQEGDTLSWTWSQETIKTLVAWGALDALAATIVMRPSAGGNTDVQIMMGEGAAIAEMDKRETVMVEPDTRPQWPLAAQEAQPNSQYNMLRAALESLQKAMRASESMSETELVHRWVSESRNWLNRVLEMFPVDRRD